MVPGQKSSSYIDNGLGKLSCLERVDKPRASTVDEAITSPPLGSKRPALTKDYLTRPFHALGY